MEITKKQFKEYKNLKSLSLRFLLGKIFDINA